MTECLPITNEITHSVVELRDRKCDDRYVMMKRDPASDSAKSTESISYIIQNLRAVYGEPALERGLDPLDVLIETILSQSTTNANSGRAFESLKRRFPTWELARRARVSSIEAAIKSGGLARQKSARIKQLLNDIHERRGSLDLSFLETAPLDEAKQFLASFKGVGPKTVACTLLFAFNRPSLSDRHSHLSYRSKARPDTGKVFRRRSSSLDGRDHSDKALLRSSHQSHSPRTKDLPASRSAMRAVLSGGILRLLSELSVKVISFADNPGNLDRELVG